MSGLIPELGVGVGFQIECQSQVLSQESRSSPRSVDGFESQISCRGRVSWLNSDLKVKSLIGSWDQISILEVGSSVGVSRSRPETIIELKIRVKVNVKS
ncbi:hypothetical protein KY290_020539 [Solanum tuberosum]|uniref:Uncharacterized protein n=1 Tax=Solanum tuberosum TaxID=4113 RepID=A0ABQ7UYX8_SOLTU|nr:hypothetical protein KY290_020539 [Solanum tuberosum]